MPTACPHTITDIPFNQGTNPVVGGMGMYRILGSGATWQMFSFTGTTNITLPLITTPGVYEMEFKLTDNMGLDSDWFPYPNPVIVGVFNGIACEDFVSNSLIFTTETPNPNVNVTFANEEMSLENTSALPSVQEFVFGKGLCIDPSGPNVEFSVSLSVEPGSQTYNFQFSSGGNSGALTPQVPAGTLYELPSIIAGTNLLMPPTLSIQVPGNTTITLDNICLTIL